MTIEVEGPDGAVVEFPDGTAPDTIKAAMGKHYAKLRPYEGWGEYGRDLGRSALQGATFNASDEIIGGMRALLGTPYAQAVKEERDALARFGEQHPVASVASQFAGGMALPAGPLAMALRAPTLGGRVAKSAGVGTSFGAVGGFGAGQGGIEERLPSAATGAVTGAAIGAVMPPVVSTVAKGADLVHGATSSTLARWQAQQQAWLRRHGIVASADGGLPPNVGAQAAAEQVAANQLHRSGRSVDDLEAQLTQADYDRRFNSNSYAQDVLAPVDLDPSLARLAGSAARQSPEAANTARTFIQARQTGLTPPGGPISAGMGLPTRAMLAQSQKDDVPAGQWERMHDGLRRALRLEDEKHHGHGRNAYRTEQMILADAKQEAQQLYGAAYAGSRNVDIRPAITPIMQKWADAATGEPMPVQTRITRALKLFTSDGQKTVSSLERFDKAKQYLDGEIEKLFSSAEGRNKYLGGVLTQLKNEMLDAVDNLPNGIGQAYSTARGAFGSAMEMRDALKLGQAVFRHDSDVGVDAYRALTSDGERKLFRLGLLDSFERHMKEPARTSDITRIFERPRIQELLAHVIPRTETAGGKPKANTVFADRPERFGRHVQNVKREIETRDTVLGNSKTAERLADDKAFDQMTALSTAIEQFKQSGSALNVGMKAMESALNKLFGMKADTAAELARMLFTADPLRRAQALASIKRRMGPNRMAQLARLMQQYQSAFVPAAGAAAAPAQ